LEGSVRARAGRLRQPRSALFGRFALYRRQIRVPDLDANGQFAQSFAVNVRLLTNRTATLSPHRTVPEALSCVVSSERTSRQATKVPASRTATITVTISPVQVACASEWLPNDHRTIRDDRRAAEDFLRFSVRGPRVRPRHHRVAGHGEWMSDALGRGTPLTEDISTSKYRTGEATTLIREFLTSLNRWWRFLSAQSVGLDMKRT
jgi:hypothetical protein